MDFNSKYKSREIEAILDQVSSGQSNIFLWNWNMAASGQLGDGEFNKLKESSIVLIGAGTSDANYYVPMVRSADDDSIVLSVHTASSEGLGNLVFSFNANGAWTMETEELTFVTEEQLDGKQDQLVSGTSIKTINNQSLLGSGNITISGGGAVPTKLSQLENDTNFVALQGEELPYVETAGLYDPISSVLYSLPGGEWTGAEDKKLAGVVNVGGFNLVECQGITGSSGDMIVLPREADGYEDDILVTRSYLKTINGESILGSGNIEISGGSGGGSAAYPYVDNTSVFGTTYFTISPNTFYEFGEHTVLEISLGAETSGVANEYLFQFVSGSEATSLTINADIKWTEELVIEPNKIYQVSILKGLASVLSWENAPEVTLITFYYNGTPYQAEEGMTWAEFADSGYNSGGFYVQYGYVFTGNYQQVYHNYIAMLSAEQIVANAFYDNNSGGGGGGGN